MIVVDSSALVAGANRLSEANGGVISAFVREPRPWIIPTPILSEIGYMLGVVGGTSTVANFLRQIADGQFVLDSCQDDAAEAERILVRYDNVQLRLADAYVVTCARRNGGRVMTLDRRHFEPLAREFGFTLLPEYEGIREEEEDDYDPAG